MKYFARNASSSVRVRACVGVCVCVCVCVDRKSVCISRKSSYCVITKAGEENAHYLEYTSPDTLFVIGLDNYIF